MGELTTEAAAAIAAEARESNEIEAIDGLTEIQHKATILLGTGFTFLQAAHELGVSVGTLHAWNRGCDGFHETVVYYTEAFADDLGRAALRELDKALYDPPKSYTKDGLEYVDPKVWTTILKLAMDARRGAVGRELQQHKLRLERDRQESLERWREHESEIRKKAYDQNPYQMPIDADLVKPEAPAEVLEGDFSPDL